jgi:outer membrane protein assembly factor BamB
MVLGLFIIDAFPEVNHMTRLARYRIVATLAIACLVASAITSRADDNNNNAANDGPWRRWRFSADAVQENAGKQELTPAAGDMPAKLSGPIRFSKEGPSAMLLDGKESYIEVGDDLASAQLPQKEFTVESWIVIDDAPEWSGIASAVQDNGDFEKGWVLGTYKHKFTFGLSTVGADDGDGRLTYLDSRTVYEPGAWYHVVATYDGRTQSIYVDGRLKNSSAVQSGAILYPKQGHFALGAYHDENELHRMAGQIHEVSLYRRALSADEVTAHFDARKAEFPGIEPHPSIDATWPTYMYDDARTGIAPDQLQLPLVEAWSRRGDYPPSPAWPPPAKQDFWNRKSNLAPRVVFDRAHHTVSDGKRVFYGTSADDRLVAIDAENGSTVWTFAAEGPVRLAPTLADGKVFFGSDDGHVYCLKGATGRLIWKFRAGPADRRIVGNGRVVSAWPIRSGVMIADGRVRFSAGLFPRQGVYQYLLDAESGQKLAEGKIELSAQGYMQRRGDQLFLSVGRAPQQFVEKLRRQGKGSGEYLGELDRDYPFALVGAGPLRIAGGDGKIAVLNAESGKTLWTAPVEGKAYSLAIAAGRLYVSTDIGVLHCFTAAKKLAAAERHANDRQTQNVANRFDDAVSEGKAEATPAAESATGDQKFASAASDILRRTKIDRGYCLVLDCNDGRLAAEIARQSKLQVVAVPSDERFTADVRRRIEQRGLSDRVAVHVPVGERLPYADYLMNLALCERTYIDGAMPNMAAKEIMRTLRPEGGTAVLVGAKIDQNALKQWIGANAANGWQIKSTDATIASFRRGPLEGAGSWTHMYADPANTVCSRDTLVEGPHDVLWFGGPGPREMIDRHHRTVAPLSVGGRLFIPGDDRVIAVDVYNGTELWNIEMPAFRRIGAMRDCGNMAAAVDRLYVAADKRCFALGADSGELEITWRPPAYDDEPKGADAKSDDAEWGYLAVVDDLLLGSATKPGAARREMSRDAIVEGTYFDFRPLVTSDLAFCYDRNSTQLKWKYRPAGAIANPTFTAADGRLYFVESNDPATLKIANGRVTLKQLLGNGASLTAIDLATGKLAWKQPVAWQALEHHIFLAHSDGVLVAVGSRNQDSGQRDENGRPIYTVQYDVHGVDAATGKPLWSQTQDNRQRSGGDHGEQDHHPAIVDGTVYVEPYAYNLRTGKRLANWRLIRDGHGCGTMSASACGLYYRADNPTVCDLATGRASRINRVSRPGCWINILPAGGLLLIPEASSGCSCNFPIQTSMAFVRRESNHKSAGKNESDSPAVKPNAPATLRP